MDELPQPVPAIQPSKRLFSHICMTYDFYDDTLQKIADMAKVDKSVVDAMFVGFVVRRADAKKVLMALSEHTGQTWDFDNLKVALMPTFADLHKEYEFNLTGLAIGTGVPASIISMMLDGESVTRQHACRVLEMVSRIAHKDYSLETVDVPVIDEEEQRG